MKTKFKAKFKEIFLILIFISSSFSVVLLNGHAQAYSSNTAPQLADTYHKNSDLTFLQEWSNMDSDVQKPSPPNVWNALNNVSSFKQENHSVYVGDETIPKPLMEGLSWTYLEINLTGLYVYDDHSDLTAGDIYFRWAPNFWIGQPEYDLNNNWQNYQYVDENTTIDYDVYNETEVYSISDNLQDWYVFSEPITLFRDWTVLSTLLFEVFDKDLPTADDSLGGYYWRYVNPQNLEGSWNIGCADVNVSLEISILDTNDTFTATDLTELFQPFLFENDDTTHTSDPNGLFARVIHGYDPAIERNAFCIQYLYYWNEVWLDGFWSDELIHYDDFELVQLYLNFSYTGGPVAYRFVFDNHDEYTNSTTEWRDSMEYAILEWDTPNSGILEKSVNNTPELQPLLGENYQASYEYKNLSIYTEDFSSCYGGVASLMLTIETYNHQFGIGDTGNILGQYYIAEYNDSVIYNCYALLNRSFSEGVHEINGENVPFYAPFAYDVLQVFTAPYIHSNYAHLMERAAEFNGDIEAEGGIIQVDRNITLTLDIPILSDISLPDLLDPGTNLTTLLESILDEANSVLTIDYYFNISADLEIWFLEYHFETIFENTIEINFSNPIIHLLCNLLGFQDEFSNSIDFFGGMMSIETLFTPQVIDQILNCNITVHINEILKYFFPKFGIILDIFFDDIFFKINPVLSGYISADISLGNSKNQLLWDSATENFNVDLEIPDFNYGDTLPLIINNIRYGLNFQVRWWLGYDTSSLISWLFGEGNDYLLTVWPDINFDLACLEGSQTLVTYEQGDTAWVASGLNEGGEDQTDDTGEPDNSGARDSEPSIGLGLYFLVFSLVSLPIIIRKRWKLLN